MAVHPRDPNTAWFVPAVKDEKRYPAGGCVVVNRTRDGGQTFDTLTRGLPQEHAYDLVFRHALDVDESGDRLASGSTTGSLWDPRRPARGRRSSHNGLDMTMKKHGRLARSGSENGSVPLSTYPKRR